MTEPRKHHYIPVCYLKQWAKTADDRLCEHKYIPGIGVKPRRTFPAGTGYKIDLYRVEGVPDEVSQDLEKKFMQMVDTQAAQSIERIVVGSTANWTGELRSGWTRFLISLLFRNSETVAMLNAHIATLWTVTMEELEQDYAARRKPDQPATLKGYYDLHLPGARHIDAAKFLASVIDDSKIAPAIFGMRWGRIDLSGSTVPLLTSDRPIDMPLGLSDPKSYIAVPIAPKILFIAAHEQSIIDNARGQNATKLAKQMNTRVIQQARTFVWGSTDSQLTYIQRNFGKLPDRIILSDQQRQEALSAIPSGENAIDELIVKHGSRA